MVKMNINKENQQSRKTSTSEEKNMLLVSSKLLADLKNKGIMAFKKMTDEEQKKVWEWSMKVIEQYRSVLKAHPSNIRNVEDLPFPKEDIKLAIQLSLPLYISKDMQSMVKKLKSAFMEIGTFQFIKDADKKELLSRADLKRRASSQNNKAIYPLSDQYTNMAVSEQKALLQEITDFVTDLESTMRDNSVET